MKICSINSSYTPPKSYKRRQNLNFASSIDDKILEKAQLYVLEAKAHAHIQTELSQKALGISEKNLEGLNPKTLHKRKEILTQWRDFIAQETSCPPKIQFAIMKSLTSNLKNNDDTLPPKLNKTVAQACINEYKRSFDFCSEAKISFLELYTKFLNEKSNKPTVKNCGPLDLIYGA